MSEPDDRAKPDIVRPPEPEIFPPPRYRGRQDDTWIGPMLVMAGLLGAFVLLVFALTWWSARPPTAPIPPVPAKGAQGSWDRTVAEAAA